MQLISIFVFAHSVIPNLPKSEIPGLCLTLSETLEIGFLMKRLIVHLLSRRVRWLSGRASDSGARGPGGFAPDDCRKVSLSKTLSKVLVNTEEAVAPSQND